MKLPSLPPHVLCLCLVAAASHAVSPSTEGYRERLVLQPLPQGALLASFNFRSNTSADSFEHQHFRHFPRSLGQTLQHAHAAELHLRFSVGRWDAEAWGARPSDGFREGGTGVEIWAWVDAPTEEEAYARWLTLTNALSGLFCASLNFIDSTRTIQPVMTFQPDGPHANASHLHLLHGTLPHEVVCTENLTPFVKMLPCKGKAGISSLLDGHKLFDASWQAMSIDVTPTCSDRGECGLEMVQNIDMVLDVERSKRPRDNPIPRPGPIEDIHCDSSKPYHSDDSCYPLDRSSGSPWSFTELFGRPIAGACPLGDTLAEASDTVCIHAPPEWQIHVNTPAPFTETKHANDTVRCYTLSVDETFDLILPEQDDPTQLTPDQTPLYAARSINGYGQERGSVQAILTNPSPTNAVDLTYLESLPWFMKPYLHTLHATIITPGLPNPHHTTTTTTTTTNPIKEIHYRPAVDRQRGTHLEMFLTVPPASTLTLTYDFDKAVLRYTEYPPDANRGFDVPPAVIRLDLGGGGGGGSSSSGAVYLRTTSLLLPLPTPDFSMPYNVIILTSTVMALAFGSIFNLLVRRFVAADEVGTPSVSVGVLRGWVGRRVRGLGAVVVRGKGTGKGGKVE